MKKFFVLNGGQTFGHAQGKLNHFLAETTKAFLENEKKYQVEITHVSQGYQVQNEVEKMLWADHLIYHTPVWWFYLPSEFKKYFDQVLTQGYGKIYKNDGRNNQNPEINYGTGGLLQGRSYLLVSTWNAPKGAFELEDEFFEQKNPDQGIFFGFHKMNSFLGLTQNPSFHFHDVMKNPKLENNLPLYLNHLQNIF